MKQNYFHLLFFSLFFVAETFSQTDPWIQVVGNGFGNVNTSEIDEFFVFQGKIYAATRRVPASGAAQLWSASTGGAGSWTQITSFSPAIPAQANAIPSVATTTLGGGIAYFGTTNMIGGGQFIVPPTELTGPRSMSTVLAPLRILW